MRAAVQGGSGKGGERRDSGSYLAIKQTVHHKEQNALQDVDDGEEVGHDGFNRLPCSSRQEESEAPRTAQHEELSDGFECHDSGKREPPRVRTSAKG